MKNKLLQTIVIIAIIYIISYIFSLEYRAYPYEVENYHLVLILFLTLAVGGIYIEQSIFKLLLLLLVPLIIGMSLYSFVIIDLLNYTCVVCGEGSCAHTKIDCDGSCYGWYTFENKEELILTQYFFNWSLPVVLTYFLKGFRWFSAVLLKMNEFQK